MEKIDWKLRFEEIRQLAINKDAEFHSVWDDSINSNFKYTITCKKHNYTWYPKYSPLKAGTWCDKCGIESANKKNTKDGDNQMALAHATAKNNDGWCLETEYKGYNHKIMWKCSNEDQPPFEATLYSICIQKRPNGMKSWCPHCGNENRHKKNTTEVLVRKFFEIIFNKTFPSLRPQWNSNQYESTPYLLNSEKDQLKFKPKETGYYPLELDGFNSELNLAFEFDGYQHYELLSFSLVSSLRERMKAHSRIKLNDFIKEENCKSQNVTLIRIPYLPQNKQKDFLCFINHIKKNSELSGVYLLIDEETKIKLKECFKLANTLEKKSSKRPSKTFNILRTTECDNIINKIKTENKITKTSGAYNFAISFYTKARNNINKSNILVEKIEPGIWTEKDKFRLNSESIETLKLIMSDFNTDNQTMAIRLALKVYKEQTTNNKQGETS